MATANYINAKDVQEGMLFLKELQLSGQSMKLYKNGAVLNDGFRLLGVVAVPGGWMLEMHDRRHVYCSWGWAMKAIRRWVEHPRSFWQGTAQGWNKTRSRLKVPAVKILERRDG